MIWYLLYPLRGTTEAPVLSPSHPLRRLLTRYGRYVARHVDTILLLAVAVAAILIYPFPFLYTTDFSNGASNLPHHVWTDAQAVRAQAGFEPDVIMRTIWVHGSYMKALDREVILGALELQNELLGSTKNFNPRRPLAMAAVTGLPNGDLTPQERDTFHVINGRTNLSWFYHSPLQYWSGDVQKIIEDEDIIGTVNAKKTLSTSVNVTLRHSIVFSGKRFEDRRLVAADALVITLVHLRDSPVGRQWARKAEALALRMKDKWTAYPADGRSMPSQLYEFQFRPISFWDLVWLSLAYFLTFIYFLHSLSKLRAVKSKTGLIVTVVVQIFASVISSFTVCAVFKIDLSRIPQAAYPIVVWSMSLENMFRLINAVIVTPSEDSTGNRIGQAFGETAHVALASVLQYLLIILGLSRVVFPGVSAFCAFAAIAILFDFFYLSTFFLSVLSVEVRRTELSDALEKSSQKHNRAVSEVRPQKSWIAMFLQGKIALSTRVAGIIVMLGFVLVAQWHFFQSETVLRTLTKMFRRSRATDSSKSSLLVDVHQARSPTSWLRLQDHDTAREVIHVVKPKAHSYVARVYDPLVFVMKGSDRNPPRGERILLPAVYDFAHHQTFTLLIAIVVLLALVRLLLNYLLWDEITGARGDNHTEDDPLISVKTVNCGHTLDVAMMAATPDGRVVSAGLDRMIWVWDVRFLGTSYVVTSPDVPERDPFPVLGMAIDDESHWLALLSSSKIRIWDLGRRTWGPSVEVELYGQKADAFYFSNRRKDADLSIVLMRRNGTMVEVWPDRGETKEYVVCKSPLSCAVPLADNPTSSQATSFLTLSRRACIHKGTVIGDEWEVEEVRLPSGEKDVQAVLPMPSYSAYLVVRTSSVELVDFATSSVIHTFLTDQIQPRTLNFFHSYPRKTESGAKGLSSFTLVYIKADGGECILQTYLPAAEEGGTISIRNAPSGTCGGCSWQETREVRRTVETPGVWAVLPSGCVVGIRRKRPRRSTPPSEPPGQANGKVRRRRATPPLQYLSSSRADDDYEVWTVTQLEKKGDYITRPLMLEDEELLLQQHLMVSELGPMVKVGMGSVAVALGNIIKIITIGHERFGRAIYDMDGLVGSRRRKLGSSSARHHRGAIPRA